MGIEATPSQISAFAITERVASIFSLFGILFILSTFLLARGFDKPINRLIFFASWSNLGMNIASLIAQDGIAAGQDSSLCQFQGFGKLTGDNMFCSIPNTFSTSSGHKYPKIDAFLTSAGRIFLFYWTHISKIDLFRTSLVRIPFKIEISI